MLVKYHCLDKTNEKSNWNNAVQNISLDNRSLYVPFFLSSCFIIITIMIILFRGAISSILVINIYAFIIGFFLFFSTLKATDIVSMFNMWLLRLKGKQWSLSFLTWAVNWAMGKMVIIIYRVEGKSNSIAWLLWSILKHTTLSAVKFQRQLRIERSHQLERQGHGQPGCKGAQIYIYIYIDNNKPFKSIKWSSFLIDT